MPRVGRLPLLIAGIFAFLFFNVQYSLASEPAEEYQNHETEEIHEGDKPHAAEEHSAEEHEKFNPGDFIFDHIGDAHDWHIITLGHTHITIPLPVIIYSKEQGFVAFMSTKFEHGHASYKGFHIGEKGELIEVKGDTEEVIKKEVKGKIVETLEDGTQVVPLDLSITKNVASIFIGVLIILIIFIKIGNAYKRNPLSPPRGLQSILEPIILFVRDEVAKPSIGEKKYEYFMPYLLTVFFFIWINNMLGLIPIFPGGANVTGNISVTLVLALFTFTITTIRGNKQYWQHIFNMPGVPVWLKVPPLPILPLIETLGIFIKPFVLMVRLFANITAGHIISLGFLAIIFLFGELNQYIGYGVSVVSVAFIIFMNLLELLVAFIQAYVFTFLSALYFGMAVEEHH